VAAAARAHLREVDGRSRLVDARIGVALAGDGGRPSGRAQRARRILRDRIREVALAGAGRVGRVCKVVTGEGGRRTQHDGSNRAYDGWR